MTQAIKLYGSDRRTLTRVAYAWGIDERLVISFLLSRAHFYTFIKRKPGWRQRFEKAIERLSKRHYTLKQWETDTQRRFTLSGARHDSLSGTEAGNRP